MFRIFERKNKNVVVEIFSKLKIYLFTDGMLWKLICLTNQGFESLLVSHRSDFILYFVDTDWIYSVGGVHVIPAQFDKKPIKILFGDVAVKFVSSHGVMLDYIQYNLS